MADNFKRNLADEAKYLQMQQDINESFKEQVTSFKGYAEYQNRINKNWGDIKIIQAQILELEKDTTVEGQKKLASLKKEQQLLIETNKQLAKQGSLIKSAANILDKNFLGVLGNILNKWFDFDEAVRKTGVNMGLSGSKMNMMQSNMIAARNVAAEWGFEAKDLAEAQGAYSDEVGRSVILSGEALKTMSMIGAKTGLGVAGVAAMSGEMEAFGFGAEKSVALIAEMSSEAEAIGANSSKVLKSFQSNLGLMNKLNFNKGVKGMMAMAAYSEKYKIDMNSVAAVADKVFRPEGAIEAAAQLQVLGGSLAALGDPFQLMYKARNSPEELAKSLTKAASASATFDKTTGEWKVNANELDRLKEAAAALGMDYSELAKTAKQTAKINAFEGMLKGKGLDPKTVDMITGMANADGTIQIGVNPDTGLPLTKKLSELSKDEAINLAKKRDLDDKTQKDAISMRQEWAAVIDQLTMAFWPLLQSIQNWLKPAADGLTSGFTKFLDTTKMLLPIIKWFSIGVATLFAAMKIMQAVNFVKNLTGAADFAKGVKMGQGFNSVTMGKGSGGAAKYSSNSKNLLKGQNPLSKSSNVAPEVPNTKGPGGITKGINMNDMIKGAAAILILSAALFVFAKALQEFDKLKNGWETMAMAAVGMLVLVGALWAISKIPSQNLIEGAFAIAFLGVSLIPLAYALSLMQNVGIGTIVVLAAGLTVLGIAGFLMGEAAPEIILGAIAIGALGLAVIPLAYAFTLVAEGISTIVTSFTQMFATIGPNGSSLLMAGLGFMAMAAGIGILTISLIALGAASLLALPGLLILGGVTSMLTQTASALSSTGGAEGITKTINAINSVDENKLQALKDLSVWMALLGATTTIKFDESLHIDGSIQIAGKSGGKSDTDWVSDPIFVSKLKQLIAESTEKDKNGGKGR